MTKQIFRVDFIVKINDLIIKIMKTMVGLFPLHRADIMLQHSLELGNGHQLILTFCGSVNFRLYENDVVNICLLNL